MICSDVCRFLGIPHLLVGDQRLTWSLDRVQGGRSGQPPAQVDHTQNALFRCSTPAYENAYLAVTRLPCIPEEAYVEGKYLARENTDAVWIGLSQPGAP
jgi:hypothetical protein